MNAGAGTGGKTLACQGMCFFFLLWQRGRLCRCLGQREQQVPSTGTLALSSAMPLDRISQAE